MQKFIWRRQRLFKGECIYPKVVQYTQIINISTPKIADSFTLKIMSFFNDICWSAFNTGHREQYTQYRWKHNDSRHTRDIT